MDALAAWLRAVGLERYLEAFRANGIDLDVVSDLTEGDLAALGVTLGDRKRLLRAIATLPASSAPIDDGSGALARAIAAASPAGGMGHAAEGERRHLTVLFADLVGSTALATRRDPEEMFEIVVAYQGCCKAVVQRYEGYVAKYLGDGVLAYFGWPRAREDDAERAVRAALELVEAVRNLRPQPDVTLRCRVGVDTGLVVFGELLDRGVLSEEAAIGNVPNLAARLQALAEPDSVVISSNTQRILGGLFDYADLGARALKGFASPVRAWRVTGLSRAAGRFDAKAKAGLMPLVGREEELDLLLGRWKLARAGQGQVALLAGEAGIGKSRLVEALHERLGGEVHIRLRCFCSPYHVDTALHPVIDQLGRAAGLRGDDSPEAKLDKLEALLRQSTDRVEEVAPLIAALCGIPTGTRYPPLHLTPQQQRTRTFEVLMRQLEGLAAKQPVLMVIEDAHWIDPTTRELLGRIIGWLRDVPVLLLITFRPEFTPPWPWQAHVTPLRLGRLGRDQGAEMVERVAGGRALPEEIREHILAKTDGVPLFVEELTKAVLESGLLVDVGGRYELRGALPPLAIPATLQDSLMARLDRLAPVKEVAQLAAALGRSFSHELLAAVSRLDPSALGDALARLLDAELIYQRGLPPEATYEFKHALVQDVAYGSMLRSKRVQLHREIADVLEERFPQVVEAEPELLAHHLRQAGLPARAVSYAVRAGDAAARRYASAEARAHYQTALEMAQALSPSSAAAASRLQIRATVRLATVALNREHFERDLANLERARELAERAGNRLRLGQVQYWIGRTNYVLGRFDAAIDHAEQALRIGEALGGRDQVTALSVNLLARVHCLRGEGGRASAYAARSADQMRRLGNAVEEAAINGVLAFALGLHGRPVPAREAADRGVALARDLDHLPTLAAAFFFRGVVAGWYGALEPAEADFAEALALSARAGDAFREYVARGWRGEAYLLAGRIDAAEDDLTRCLALGERIGTTFHRGAYQAFLAKVRLLRHDVDAALRLVDEALTIATDTAQPWSRSIALRVLAEVLLRSTEPPDLPRALEAARTAITTQRERECLPDLARSHLVLGEVLRASGDREGADAAFDAARRLFDGMGITPSPNAASALTRSERPAPRPSLASTSPAPPSRPR